MTVRLDMEFADTIAAARHRTNARAALTGTTSPNADRTTARWARIRAALCEHHGLGRHESLDAYADRVWSAVSNTTAPAADPGRTLRGRRQKGL